MVKKTAGMIARKIAHHGYYPSAHRHTPHHAVFRRAQRGGGIRTELGLLGSRATLNRDTHAYTFQSFTANEGW